MTEHFNNMNRPDKDLKLNFGGAKKWLLLFQSPGIGGKKGQFVFGFKKINNDLNNIKTYLKNNKVNPIGERFINVLHILKNKNAGEVMCADIFKTLNDYHKKKIRTDIRFNNYDSIVVFGKETQKAIKDYIFSGKLKKVKSIYYVTHLSPQTHVMNQFEVFKPLYSDLKRNFESIWKNEKKGGK